ncbi:signal recognition particle receptor FtsY [archaeon BMS3Abin17]|nr:signal recognition particle receptor FtsY [archaeon BMS3Abin17]HDZ61061.1 signal recognition particle-docking protein FtsY [Candidatus Pacearchaeota archaeon]
MFGKLKEKLKNWAKKVSEKVEKKPIEEVVETKKETLEKLKEKSGVEKTKPIKKIDIRPKEIEKPVEEIKEPEEPGKQSFFKKVTSKISKVKITEKEFEIYKDELEMLLLENNVALEVAEKMIQELKEKIVGKELLKKEVEGEIKEDFKEIIENILIEPFKVEERIKEKIEDQSKEPYVILFCGINGTGKTTTIAKIAQSLKNQNISCVLAAADTFRAASIEQLKKHGEKIGVNVISNEYGSDPASVGFDAIQHAKKNMINCVLIDTAGRMHTAKNLIKEIEKISKVCKPDLKIFVGESLTGNDIIEQVKSFDWALGIEGIILTKSDVDEKGGTALSVGYITRKPILYLGTGQDYDKIEPFDKQKFIKTLGL